MTASSNAPIAARTCFPVVILVSLLALAACAAGCAVVSPPDKKGDDTAVVKPVTVMKSGHGIFGKWITDRYGLPAYEYTMDQRTDPRARWDPRTAPESTLMWFPLGNGRITALAYNHGFVELFFNDSDPRWINAYDPGALHFSGGFGFVREGNDVFTTLHEHGPPGARFRRIFGMGYFTKIIEHRGLLVEQTVCAPVTEPRLPLLVSETRLRNLGGRTRTIQYFEYWDVNMRDVSVLVKHPVIGRLWRRSRDLAVEFRPAKGMLVAQGSRIWGPDGGFPGGPAQHDPEDPAVFLAALDGRAESCEFDRERLFSAESRWLRGPQALSGMRTAEAPACFKAGDGCCLVLGTTITLKPGEEKSVRYAYGYAKGVTPETLIASLGDASTLSEKNAAAWKRTLPRYEGPQRNCLSREVQWDSYCCGALTQWDGYHRTPFLPQGGNYLYTWGLPGAIRDLAAYAQTFSYYNPPAAKDQLRLMLRWQRSDGRFYYSMSGYGDVFQLYYRPSDLGLWMLQALTEYIAATRDFDFLREEVPFYPKEKGRTGTVYLHAWKAYRDLRERVGAGRHGLIRIMLSDWNDEMSFLAAGGGLVDTAATVLYGESTLNTAMACAILPGFARLALRYGDHRTAADALKWRAELAGALRAQWKKQGWLNRACSGLGREYGVSELWLEPQVYALMAGDILNEAQARALVTNIRELLMEPSALGMMISSGRKGSSTTRAGEQEGGGIWYAMNAPAAVALSCHDPALAFRELVRNSLAWHADTYPSIWYGIWSGPDCFNSARSQRPGETWYQETPLGPIGPQEFPVMNAHSHAQLLYALARLAGLGPGIDEYTVAPCIPGDRFDFETPWAGLKRRPSSLEGFFVFGSDGDVPLVVKVPGEWNGKKLSASVDGGTVRHDTREGRIVLVLPGRKARPVRWGIKAH